LTNKIPRLASGGSVLKSTDPVMTSASGLLDSVGAWKGCSSCEVPHLSFALKAPDKAFHRLPCDHAAPMLHMTLLPYFYSPSELHLSADFSAFFRASENPLHVSIAPFIFVVKASYPHSKIAPLGSDFTLPSYL
jgi:hypothetical protein